MKAIHAVKHVVIILTGATLLLLLPFLKTDYFKAWLAGDLEATSSATTAVEAPSGDYLILINSCMHTDEEVLNDWITFFNDGDIGFNFENLKCEVISGDTGAADTATHFQGRLPENQMVIDKTDATMLLSRIKYDKYDIAILSQEFADSYDLTDNVSENTIILNYRGASE